MGNPFYQRNDLIDRAKATQRAESRQSAETLGFMIVIFVVTIGCLQGNLQAILFGITLLAPVVGSGGPEWRAVLRWQEL